MIRNFVLTLGLALTPLSTAVFAGDASRAALDALIAAHARANGVPEALVHRVIVRESRYNSRVIGKGGAMGLMQIKAATARGVGYTGSAAALLDPETNLTYAVRYLGGAYRLAGGNHDRAVSYYAGGYYYAAKERGLRIEALTQPVGLTPLIAIARSDAAKKETSILSTAPSARIAKEENPVSDDN